MKWTPETETELRRLWSKLPLRDIADHFGTTLYAVAAKAKRMGLSSRSVRGSHYADTRKERGYKPVRAEDCDYGFLAEYGIQPMVWTHMRDPAGGDAEVAITLPYVSCLDQPVLEVVDVYR